MSELPLGYEQVAPATWVYLSSLLMVALFFKFNRMWSVRNLDLFLLILLAPGLLLVHAGREGQRRASVLESDRMAVNNASQASLSSTTDPEANLSTATLEATDVLDGPQTSAGANTEDASSAEIDSLRSAGKSREKLGFIWLFATGALMLTRMLIDPLMVRRPLLEPNLSTGGLVFLGIALIVFLMANVIASDPTSADLEGPRLAVELGNRIPTEEDDDRLTRHGPGYALINFLVSIPTIVSSDGEEHSDAVYAGIAKVMAIIAQLAIVGGLIFIGYRHFSNARIGIGIATLYLMLPYTSQMTGRIDHAIPAALIVWAIAMYRRPLTAGIFIGLACGTVYYPLFLLPLWISFYWQRGLLRFVGGAGSMLLVMVLSLIFVSSDAAAFWSNVQKMFGLWWPQSEGLEGIWGLGWDPVYRISVLAAFVALSGSFAFWPAQKNLGTLMSCSAAVMLATQFWHGFGGGLFMAWYLPLALLTIFRPNLEDRVALSVLGDSWLKKRRMQRRARAA